MISVVLMDRNNPAADLFYLKQKFDDNYETSFEVFAFGFYLQMHQH